MRKVTTVFFSTVFLLILCASEAWAQKGHIYYLGNYSGGTWAELHSINDFGVAMGWGDVATGDARMIGVPVFGPRADVWFEAKETSSNDDWFAEGGGISNTGLIVGSIQGSNGCAQAYAWTPNHPGITLGALADDCGSAAMAINRTGTLIVGLSYRYSANSNGPAPGATAVVWTPNVVWQNGQLAVNWKVNKLPTNGWEQPDAVWTGVTLNWWGSYGVNDLGQIVGDAWSDNYDEIAVVWNPVGGNQKWEIQQLPHQSTFPTPEDFVYTEALSINNRGEITGDISADYWNTDLPALWVTSVPNAHTWKLVELPTLGGTPGVYGVAWGINDLGDVVGVSTDANGNSYATHWCTKDPSKVNLVGFPGDYSRAMGVNNAGIVVGRYSYGGGPMQATAVALH